MSSVKIDSAPPQIDVTKPRWDQSVYSGRAKHFFQVTNPLNLLTSRDTLYRHHALIADYKAGRIKLGQNGLTESKLWKSKYLVGSAFHPETDEYIPFYGRMSTKVPANIFLIGGMLVAYQNRGATIFFQWLNQTYNAGINYANRSGTSSVTPKQLLVAYSCATGGALTAALGLGALAHRFPPLLARLVPFCAVATANCINIPCMRTAELNNGIPLYGSDLTEPLGHSFVAAKLAVGLTVVSRILMSTPGMVLPPILMTHLTKRNYFKGKPFWISATVNIAACSLCLVFATPMFCGLFPQYVAISPSFLEPQAVTAQPPTGVYFNKGL